MKNADKEAEALEREFRRIVAVFHPSEPIHDVIVAHRVPHNSAHYLYRFTGTAIEMGTEEGRRIPFYSVTYDGFKQTMITPYMYERSQGRGATEYHLRPHALRTMQEFKELQARLSEFFGPLGPYKDNPPWFNV